MDCVWIAMSIVDSQRPLLGVVDEDKMGQLARVAWSGRIPARRAQLHSVPCCWALHNTNGSSHNHPQARHLHVTVSHGFWGPLARLARLVCTCTTYSQQRQTGQLHFCNLTINHPLIATPPLCHCVHAGPCRVMLSCVTRASLCFQTSTQTGEESR